jgi:hypothetical protein
MLSLSPALWVRTSAVLASQHLGESSDGPLRRLVRRDPLRRSTPTDGRDLHDVTGPLRAKQRQRRAPDVHDSEEVRLDLRAEVVVCDVSLTAISSSLPPSVNSQR